MTHHDWNPTPAAARALQRELARRVLLRTTLTGAPALVAGVDVGFEDGNRTARAAVVVLRYPSMTPIEQKIARRPAEFPYVPGLLSFRELPAVLDALANLDNPPDLIVCDGQGIAHPRRLGIASHLGVLLDKPTIGVAKKKLVGAHGPVPEKKGEWTPLRDGNGGDGAEVIGAVLRSRERVKPLYVSPGHRIGLEDAVRLVTACLGRYRLPEPTRLADKLSKAGGTL